jgi:transposase
MPLVNHLLERLGLDPILERFVPTDDRRIQVAHARCLGVLLRSLVVDRGPIYREAEVVGTFAPEVYGLSEAEARHLGDDRLGRALDELFDADRGALLTEVALAMHRRLGVAFERFHNDSTTVRFQGRYAAARGRSIRGRQALSITRGHSKDRRPDLKQLLLILTTTDDGHVPVAFRCADGNTSDVTTHRETWEGLRQLAGTPGFLYVADAKLCSTETMEHIHREGGRLITVLPRSRREDTSFRRFILTHPVPWETVRDREGPRGRSAPRDVWRVWRSEVPSLEGWPVTWVFSSLLAQRQATTRQEHIERAQQELADLKASLASPRSRLRKRSVIHERLRAILLRLEVTRYLRVKVETEEAHSFRQTGPGRPGRDTTYRRLTKKRYTLSWTVHTDQVERDRRHDGMFPLLSNDPALSPQEVFRHYKRQPRLESRFRQLKDPMAIAPVFLKNEGRIEAFFFLYALALLVQALLERELRAAMDRETIESLPLYPEARPSKFPTATQILRVFAGVERHQILSRGEPLKTVHPALNDLQTDVLRLLGVPISRYRCEPA